MKHNMFEDLEALERILIYINNDDLRSCQSEYFSFVLATF